MTVRFQDCWAVTCRYKIEPASLVVPMASLDADGPQLSEPVHKINGEKSVLCYY